MAKKLSEFKTGDVVMMGCYKTDCTDVSISVILGEEAYIGPGTSFTGAGRFSWSPNTPRRVFNLKRSRGCLNCNTLLGSVNIVGEENPIIFGYEREPA